MEKDSIFNKWCWSTGCTCRRMKLIHSYLLVQAQVQVDQGPPHKTRYTETNRRESGESLQTHGHRGNFLNRTPMAYALRSRIDKWDLIKLQSFCKAKTLSIGQKGNQQIGKRSLPILNLIEANIQYIQRTQEVGLQKPNNPIKNGYRAKQRILN